MDDTADVMYLYMLADHICPSFPTLPSDPVNRLLHWTSRPFASPCDAPSIPALAHLLCDSSPCAIVTRPMNRQ